jgi:AcrR family transcriptional regulator
MDQALDRALEVFCRNGYEASSVADLTEAMGINPPSLYAAFGNKEGLFRKALDRYIEQKTQFWERALQAPTARGMVEQLLRDGVAYLTEQCDPPGCPLVRGTISCSEAAEAVQRDLIARRAVGETALRERFQRARAEGEFPTDLDPADYARYIMAVMEGMSVRATAGATRAELDKVVDMTMRTWPLGATA